VASVGHETLHVRSASTAATTVVIPDNATALRVRARSTGGTGSPMDTVADLFLLNCADKDGSCYPNAHTAVTGDSARLADVRKPQAGRWMYVVLPRFDHPRTAGATLVVDLHDAVLAPAYGAVAVDDQPARRTSGATWRASIRVTPGTPLGDRRTQSLYAAFQADSAAMIGITPMTAGAP
jgi:hypothetical protein